MNTPLTKHTVFTFFSGNATPLQKKLVEDWLADAANVELYYEWLEQWEREQPQLLVNTDKALQNFSARIAKEEQPVEELIDIHAIKPRRFQSLAYAAAVTAVLMVIAFLGRDYIRYEHYETAFAEVESLDLPDGSTVTLNANSTLRIPRFGFGTRTREVYLEGEAEFSVVHTADDQKFLVRTPDHLEVEVLGTQFVVYSRQRGSKVVLSKGKVLLRSLTDTLKRSLAIRPGDVVTIHKGVFDVKQNQPVEIHNAWKEHRFVFDHTPLKEIAYQMEENFGLQVQIENNVLAKRELTGTYEADNADDFLQVLARVLNLEVKQSGKKIIMNAR